MRAKKIAITTNSPPAKGGEIEKEWLRVISQRLRWNHSPVYSPMLPGIHRVIADE
jgi:hypothetical protein